MPLKECILILESQFKMCYHLENYSATTIKWNKKTSCDHMESRWKFFLIEFSGGLSDM